MTTCGNGSFDLHGDHRALFHAASVAWRPVTEIGRGIRRVLCYEVLSETHWNAPYLEPGFLPTRYEVVTETMETKLRALACYASQMRPFPDIRSLQAIQALAQLRGAQVGVPAAEERLRVGEGEVLCWQEGYEVSVREVAAHPDDLPRTALGGRARLSRLEAPSGPVLVREYRKGGRVRYLRAPGLRGSWRPLEELVLHRRLGALGVPVAEAVGCVVLLGSVGWRGFLLVREEEGAVDLEALLHGVPAPLDAARHLSGGDTERFEQPLEHVGRGPRVLGRVPAFDVEAAVVEGLRKAVRQVNRQGGLPDAGHASDEQGTRHPAATVAVAPGEPVDGLLELPPAAREVGDVGGQLGRDGAEQPGDVRDRLPLRGDDRRLPLGDGIGPHDHRVDK